jgi:hypothetical protein
LVNYIKRQWNLSKKVEKNKNKRPLEVIDKAFVFGRGLF